MFGWNVPPFKRSDLCTVRSWVHPSPHPQNLVPVHEMIQKRGQRRGKGRSYPIYPPNGALINPCGQVRATQFHFTSPKSHAAR
eukprot:1180034-Prorocentrum_minimum.AAC.3